MANYLVSSLERVERRVNATTVVQTTPRAAKVNTPDCRSHQKEQESATGSLLRAYLSHPISVEPNSGGCVESRKFDNGFLIQRCITIHKFLYPMRAGPVGDLPSDDQINRKCACRNATNPRTFLAIAIQFLLPPLLLFATNSWAGQAELANPAASLPDAPLPLITLEGSRSPCRVVTKSESAGALMTASAASAARSLAGTAPGAGIAPATSSNLPPPCSPPPSSDSFFQRFVNGPEVKPLTPREKAGLAFRNILDPFNALTILGTSAVAIGTDSHTAYGPGLGGFARNVGVSYTQDITGEFFGTFLIPSIVHQDPHYHRMPNASIPRRFSHAIIQVLWTQGDNGKGMINYANVFGFAICDEISNLYVPGRETDLGASAARYATGFGFAPIDNFITEFLPDVASHIHVRVVIIQRVINNVAKNGI
jgi:hypothetical protein